MDVIFAILFAIIIILLIIETFFYKQLIDFAISFTALANVYNTTITGLSEEAIRLGADQLKVRQDMDLYEKEIHVLRLVVGIHSEALNVKQLKDLFDAVDALRNN